MKKILFISLFFFSLSSVFGQSAKQNVARDFIDYSTLIIEKKTDLALEYINPKMFELFPKEQMKSLMEVFNKMPNLEYKISMPTITELSDVKEIDSVYYIQLKTLSSVEMKFSDMDLSKKKISNMLHSFESRYGKGNVAFDKKTGFFKINAHKEILASSTDNQENWKFITVDNPRMKTLLEKILPAEILN